MKKSYFFTVTFKQYDQNALGINQEFRILAGNQVFYGENRAFRHGELLTKLEQGDEVCIGASQLSDGSYYLHWLYSADKGVMEPKKHQYDSVTPSPVSLIKKLGLIAALGTLVTLTAFYFWALLLVLVPVLVAGYFFIKYASNSLIAEDKFNQELQKGLNAVMQGDRSSCLSDDSLIPPRPQEEADRIDDLNETYNNSLVLIREKVNSVTRHHHMLKIKYGYMHINEATFQCQNQNYNMSYYITDPLLGPKFNTHEHPVFLTKNDSVTLIYNRENNKVCGLFNEIDGSAYLNKNRMYMSPKDFKGAYYFLFFIFLFMLFIVSSINIFEWWGADALPDRWDWIEYIEVMTFFGLFSISFFCVLMLILEITNLIFYRRSSQGRNTQITRSMLYLLRQRQGRSKVIQEHIECFRR
ncbi:hypothetical protein EKN56_07655 [Limnobaculum zhutongyuii]|uniref:Uncharacterized protein n=1 Tax=Limnobaculum zhutongyuii TaxID=2498113 RepID=A0A411WJC3_9GAMM|nr:hypothetical protein [Limnobaculum zhutongyuii]QBH96282.1 hypothetical protein EKN56_07655 [Limnobaculum zhutongyuii]TQS87130.1 hypothetical protein ELQ32_15605 [Limnobaculum zhutongyuii]